MWPSNTEKPNCDNDPPDKRNDEVHMQLILTASMVEDKLGTSGKSWGCVSRVDSDGRTIWIADAHRDDEKRFVVRADEKLTALVELEAEVYARAE